MPTIILLYLPAVCGLALLVMLFVRIFCKFSWLWLLLPGIPLLIGLAIWAYLAVFLYRHPW